MPNNQPMVGIVILNWNGFDHTAACVRALSALDYPCYKVIVVDNHSTDGSAAKIKAEFPHIVTIENPENLGFAGGVNKGIEYALLNCDYIWLLNNDAVIMNKEALSELVQACQENPHIGAAGSVIYTDEDHIQFSGARISFPRLIGKHNLDPLKAIRGTDYVTGCSMLIPAKVIQECGLMEEKYFLYYEDADFCYTLKSKGYRCVVVPASRIAHELGGTSKKNPSINYVYYNLRNRLLFAFTWLKGASLLWFLLLVTCESLLRFIRFNLKGQNSVAKLLLRAFLDGIYKRTGPYTAR